MRMFCCATKLLKSDPSKLLINSDQCRKNNINKNIIEKNIKTSSKNMMLCMIEFDQRKHLISALDHIGAFHQDDLIRIDHISAFHSSASWLDATVFIMVIGAATTAADELLIPLFIAVIVAFVIAVWALIASATAFITGFVIS